MSKQRHSRAGRRLIAAMQEVVNQVEGKVAIPIRYVELSRRR
jgi:hypothetical protein